LNKAGVVLLLLVVLFSSCIVGVVLYRYYMVESSQYVAPPRDDLIAGMISRINETEIYNTVYRLQNFTSRVYGYAGNVEAADYIYDRLENISGLSVEYQGIYRNVIATLPGTDPTSAQIYVVGAHYDSTSSDPSVAPGATDDGGGVAIVLELARIMSEYRFNHTVKFAFWNREESGLAGSSDFVQNAMQLGLNISLYLNYDSSCYDPDDGLVLDIMFNDQSRWVSQLMTQFNTIYGIGFTLTYNAHTCGSDHRPFWQSGYTAIMTHEETHGPAHTESDTVDKVSTLYAMKNAQLGMSVLAELAGVEN
jgi:Peptidase family M28